MFAFNRILESKLLTYLIVIVTCNCIHLIYWKYIIREYLTYGVSFFFHATIIIRHNGIFMKANQWSHLSFGMCYYRSTWQKSSFNSPLAANSGFSCKTFLVFAKNIFLKNIFVDKNTQFECVLH